MVPPIEGPSSPVTVTHIRKGLGKVAGPSGVVSEMLKAAGEDGLEKLRLFCHRVLVTSPYFVTYVNVLLSK